MQCINNGIDICAGMLYFIRCPSPHTCWEENSAATILCCISDWREIVRKRHSSENLCLHLFPCEAANQHSHRTGRAAFTRSEITHFRRSGKVVSSCPLVCCSHAALLLAITCLNIKSWQVKHHCSECCRMCLGSCESTAAPELQACSLKLATLQEL